MITRRVHYALSAFDFSGSEQLQHTKDRAVNPVPGSSLIHQVFSTGVPFVVLGREEVCCCRPCMDSDFDHCIYKDYVSAPSETRFSKEINHLPSLRSVIEIDDRDKAEESLMESGGPMASLLQEDVIVAIFSESAEDFDLVKVTSKVKIDTISENITFHAIMFNKSDKDINPNGCSIYLLTNTTIQVDLKRVIKLVSSLKLVSKKQRKKLARYSLGKPSLK